MLRHEDGTIRFWDASGVALRPLYKLSTANIFQTDCDHNDSLTQANEEEWPPFQKVSVCSRTCGFDFYLLNETVLINLKNFFFFKAFDYKQLCEVFLPWLFALLVLIFYLHLLRFLCLVKKL